MDKVIFLDCDGVLNRAQTGDMRYFTPSCFTAFRRIVAETGAKVVLSTSWREFVDWETMLRDYFGAIGISVIGKTDVIRDAESEDVCNVRAEEIRRYIESHSDKIGRYVVLDDIDMREEFPGHCICTCAYHRIGLDEGWADEAIGILNGGTGNSTNREMDVEDRVVEFKNTLDSIRILETTFSKLDGERKTHYLLTNTPKDEPVADEEYQLSRGEICSLFEGAYYIYDAYLHLLKTIRG